MRPVPRDSFCNLLKLAATPLWPPIIALILVFFPLPVSLVSAGQAPRPSKDITYRVLDPQNGKPVSKIAVWLTAWNVEEFHGTSSEEVASGVQTTDRAGKITFHLPQLLPEHFKFSIAPWDGPVCSTGEFSPEEVLRNGAIAKYDVAKCGPTKVVLKAAPGEVVALEIPYTLWQKMRREIP